MLSEFLREKVFVIPWPNFVLEARLLVSVTFECNRTSFRLIRVFRSALYVLYTFELSN